MKAVGYRTPGPVDRSDALQDIELETPQPQGRDLLVKIAAVSVNPIDTKLRGNRPPENEWAVLGFDASGVVEAVGPEVRHYRVGDAVYYAGCFDRPGTNSEFHLVDERIVGTKPHSLSHAEAAALPLTAITAWEMLFDRLDVNTSTPQGGNSILIIGGAGGVGSIAIQLLRALTDLTVIATASRPETRQWVQDCGAHCIIDHSQALAPQLKALGLAAPGFVFSTTQSARHFTDIAELIAPQGRLGVIDDLSDVSIMPLKQKSLSLHWEFMFTRPLYATPDIAEQGAVLNRIAELVDCGEIRSTLSEVAGGINADNLRRVHALIESGKAKGKIVLEGF